MSNKQKLSKKILALFLSFALIFGMIPGLVLTVSADGCGGCGGTGTVTADITCGDPAPWGGEWLCDGCDDDPWTSQCSPKNKIIEAGDVCTWCVGDCDGCGDEKPLCHHSYCEDCGCPCGYWGNSNGICGDCDESACWGCGECEDCDGADLCDCGWCLDCSIAVGFYCSDCDDCSDCCGCGDGGGNGNIGDCVKCLAPDVPVCQACNWCEDCLDSDINTLCHDCGYCGECGCGGGCGIDLFDNPPDRNGDNWSWVQSTRTLTLNGLELDFSGSGEAITLPANSTIELIGTNNIVSENHGIYADGNLTIMGSGTLIIDATNGDPNFFIFSNGINADGNIIIQSGTITIDAYWYGINVDNNTVTINGGTVTVKGGEASIFGDLTVTGGTVTTTGDIDGDLTVTGGTVNINGDIAGDLTVTGGTVTTTGDIDGTLTHTGGTLNDVTPPCTHDFPPIWTVSTAATCTAAGVETRTCTRNCGETETQATLALGHDHAAEFTQTLAPTCAAVGKESRKCTRCDDRIDERDIATIPHVWGTWTVRTAATCTDDGVEFRECTQTNCDHEETQPIVALSHDFGAWGGNTATCTAAGVETRTCTRNCGETETQPTSALGHDLPSEWTERTPPTCTAVGEEYRRCSRFSVCDHEVTQEIAALGHDHAAEFTQTLAPTCAAVGKESRKCTRCDDRIEERDIATIPHVWEAWEISGANCVRMCQNSCTQTESHATSWSAWITDTRNCTHSGCTVTETRVPPPTTEVPTTQHPTTQPPTTQPPTTEAPTTEAPTTEVPTTQPPTTQAPTTEAPTTEAPTTEAPTTEAPTTEAPTTQATTEPVTEPVTQPVTIVHELEEEAVAEIVSVIEEALEEARTAIEEALAVLELVGNGDPDVPPGEIETIVVNIVLDLGINVIEIEENTAGFSFTLPETIIEVLSETVAAVLEAIENGVDIDYSVTLPFGIADLTIDLDALILFVSGDEPPTIEVSVIEQSSLGNMQAAQAQAGGFDTIISLDVFFGDTKVDVPMTVSLPYNLKPNENPAAVRVWYMDDNGNLTDLNGVFDAATGMITFTINHQSYFVVGYDSVALWVNIFSDINTDAWYYEAVAYANYHGLFSGYGGGVFAPQDTMTGAMFVTVLWNLAGNPEPDGVTSAAESWYRDAVLWAVENGITDGTDPNSPVTRQEMAVMLMNYADFKGYDIPVNRDAPDFSDKSLIASWAETAVKAMSGSGVLSGYDNNFNPTDTATRAEVAEMFRNFMRFVVTVNDGNDGGTAQPVTAAASLSAEMNMEMYIDKSALEAFERALQQI